MNEPTITVTGNLTNDPELRYTPTGNPVALLRLASTPRRRDDSGQWVDGTTTFLDAEVWGALAENACESFRKGSRVLLTGRLRTDVWTPTDGDQAGIEQRRIRISIDELALSIKFAPARSVKAERATSTGIQQTGAQQTDDSQQGGPQLRSVRAATIGRITPPTEVPF